jgi:DNA-binding NarL/FixJ family response regulator
LTLPTDGDVQVILVEEQEIFRGGLRTVFESAGLTVALEYSSANAALENLDAFQELDPRTVVLCSLSLVGWQELVRQLLLQSPDRPILSIVDAVTEEVAVDSLSNGILGCMDRTLALQSWVESIRKAHEGCYSSAQTLSGYPGVARYTMMLFSRPLEPTGMQPLAPNLSHRERLALASLSEGVPMDEIVERMGVSEQDLQGMLESTCRKLAARHRLSRTLNQIR